MTITEFLEAAKKFIAQHQGVYDDDYHSELEIAARNAAPDIEELVDLCRTALHERWYEDDPRWDRIREIVGGGVGRMNDK